jgi:outer membrane receptor protein involved in Fe transport
MKSSICFLAVSACALWLTQAVPVQAQVATAFAQLNGTVRDASGGAVAKASMGIREVETNRAYTAATNDEGQFVFTNLPPGRYEMTAQSAGFAKNIRTGLTLRVGQTATADLELQIAAHGDDVFVSGEVPLVEPTKTEISQVIDQKQIDSLPISGRLFTDFALLTAGVATGRTSLQSTITEFEVTRVSFGGMRDLSNEVTVDGADTINTVTGSQRSTPPQESVSEFRVVNNSFGADYGRALGGIVNIVTKSGTNLFHGALYDYLQNDVFDARSLLQPSPQPDTLRQNQFGAAFEGPLRHDKTFFFVNFEGLRSAGSPTYPATLTDNLAFINAAKAALGLAPENLNILRTKDHDNGLVKVDHQFSGNQRLSLRYGVEDSRDLNLLVGNTLDGGGIGAPSSGHNAYTRDQTLVGTLTSVLAPNLVNTFLGQWARRHYDFPGDSGQPNLDIPNTLLFGHNFGVFDYIGESRAQLSDSTSWVKGSHVIQVGADVNFLFDKVTWPGFTPMRIVLPGLNCLAEFANFVNPAAHLAEQPALGPCPLPPSLNGTPIVFWGAAVGNGPVIPGSLPSPIPTNWNNAYLPSLTNDFNVHLNHSYIGFFAQDQWKVTPKVTLNYGLRWEFEKGLQSEINPDYRNFGPRIGIAYSPNKKTVIRAGYGIFYDRYSLSFVFVTYPERPVVIPGVSLPGVRTGSANAGWVLNQLTPGPAGLPADAAKTLLLTGQLPANYITGPCPPSCTAGAALVDHNSRTPYSEQSSFEVEREIAHGFTVSAGYLFVAAHHLVRAENLNVSLPVGTLPDGKDLFAGPLYQNAGLLYYTDNSGNSVYHGLELQASQRYSQYFHFNANYTFSKTLDDGTFTTFVSTPQDLYKRNLERALSNQDVRHRFVANFVLEGPRKTVLRNIELSSIITLESPRPFTLFVGFDANNDTNPVTDRVGQSARNTYAGDKLESFDLRLSRHFGMGEHLKALVAVDAFNLFNRANVDELDSVYGAPDFIGAIPRNYKDGVGSPVNPLFGQPLTMFNPRQLQVSAKFTF